VRTDFFDAWAEVRHAVLSAPKSFLILAILLAVGAYLVASWYYSGQLRIHRAVSRLYDAAEDSAAERAVLLRTLELIFAYASAWGYDLQGAMEEKLSYNIGRVDHTHAARAAAGGKKW
jgi:hypothetical protein